MTTHPCNKFEQYCLQKQHVEAARKVLVVLMITLFFISAILLLLYFYTKFFLKRQVQRRAAIHQVAAPFMHSTAKPPETTGLDPSAIALLPLFLYKLQEGKTRHECAVCLSIFEEEEIARLLPNCNHLFHAKCVDEWLSRHTNCPVCRAEATPTDRAPRADVGAEGAVEEVMKVEGLESRLGSFGRSLGNLDRSLGDRRELDGCARVVGSGDNDDIARQEQ